MLVGNVNWSSNAAGFQAPNGEASTGARWWTAPGAITLMLDKSWFSTSLEISKRKLARGVSRDMRAKIRAQHAASPVSGRWRVNPLVDEA